MFKALSCAILCASYVLPGCAAVQATTGQPGELLTLEQAVALASEKNRQVGNAALEVEKAELELAIARRRNLPVFGFTAIESQPLTPITFRFKTGSFGVYQSTGPIPPADTSIVTPRFPPKTILNANITQPLSQLYQIGLGVRMYEANRDIAREKLRQERLSATTNVKRAYYGVLQAQSGLVANEEAIKLLRELDRVVGEYVGQQAALKSDSLDMKAKLARAEYDHLTIRNTTIQLKEQLNHLLGRDIRTEFSVQAVPDPTEFEVNLAAAQARALSQRPELREAKLRVKQSEYDFRLKKADRLPEVNLTFQQYGMFNLDVLPRNISAVALMFKWDIYDWGRKKRELAEKGKVIEQANQVTRDVESMVLMDVNNRFRKLQEARELAKVQKLEEDREREKLRVTMEKYNQGAAQLKDVLQMQTSLAQSSYQYREAVLSLWTARAELAKALGEE